MNDEQFEKLLKIIFNFLTNENFVNQYLLQSTNNPIDLLLSAFISSNKFATMNYNVLQYLIGNFINIPRNLQIYYIENFLLSFFMLAFGIQEDEIYKQFFKMLFENIHFEEYIDHYLDLNKLIFNGVYFMVESGNLNYAKGS